MEFHNLEIKNGKTLQNNTVKFVYSTCSGSGGNAVNCENIANVINGMGHFGNAAQFLEAQKDFENLDKMFEFGFPDNLGFDEPHLEIFGKRDESDDAKQAVDRDITEEDGMSEHSMVLGKCKESTVKRN